MRRRRAAATLAALVMVAGAFTITAQSRTARPATLTACETLGGFTFPKTAIGAATMVAAGTLTNAGAPVDEHCLVTGAMNRRVSQIDGETYAIGFEVRLPREWNGRFLYQGNGGTDGVVVPAVGAFVGGGPLKHALQL
jgi:feruloyl esterase